jgi:hypothetical protein
MRRTGDSPGWVLDPPSLALSAGPAMLTTTMGFSAMQMGSPGNDIRRAGP